ncbi:MAG: ABC transporter permease [Solirubrobacteraceae bacterium]
MSAIGARVSDRSERVEQRPREADTPPEGFVETVGDITLLATKIIRQSRFALVHYLPEVIRQAGILVTGSTGVIFLITALSGGTCGLEISIIGRQFGAPTVVPGGEVLCAVHEVCPFVFGYILSAKVGCGIVAELGAMQVREEVDAIDVMGVRSVAYLLSTRMLAAWLVLPFTFIIAQAGASAAAYVVSAVRFGDISSGTWIYEFFSFFDINDIVRVLIKGLAMLMFVLSTSLYFGYKTRGGPVEVGVNTARSMAVNIVGVTLINVGLSLLYWGSGVPFPVA